MSGVDIDALEGWLEKEKSRGKFAFLGDTNKRWFKVQAAEGPSGSELTLCYFRSNKDTQPRGWIYLRDVLEVHDSLNKLTLITSTRELRLRAATRAEQRLWSKSLKQLCPTARVLGSPDSDDSKQVAELKEPIDVQHYSPRSVSPRQQPTRAAAKETNSAAPRSEKAEGPSRMASAASSRSGTPTTNGNHAGSHPMTTREEPRHGTSTSTRLHQHIAERRDSDADRKAMDVPNDAKSQPPPSPYRSDIPELEELEDIAVPAATRVTTVAPPPWTANNAQAPAIVRSESKEFGASDADHPLPRAASAKEVTDFPIIRRVGSFAEDLSDEDERALDLEAEKARLVERAQAKAREEEQQRTQAAVSKATAAPAGRPPLPSKAKTTVASLQPKSTVTASASSSSGGGSSGARRSVGTPPPFKRAYDPGVTPDQEFADDDWDQEDEASVAKAVTTREKKKDGHFGGYAGGVKPDENWLEEDFDD